MSMPYRGAHAPMKMAPGLISVVLGGTDVNHGAMLLRHRGITSEAHVVGQVKASCMCANSIILDLMGKTRKPKMSGTNPSIVIIDEHTRTEGREAAERLVQAASTHRSTREIWSMSSITTEEYTELRAALVDAVHRGAVLFTRGPSTHGEKLRDHLYRWGGMHINQWFGVYMNHRHPGESITQFVERQTKEQHP